MDVVVGGHERIVHQGFAVLGISQPFSTRCGDLLLRGSSKRCRAATTKLAVCSSVFRLSRGSDIHSRMTVLRIDCLPNGCFLCRSSAAGLHSRLEKLAYMIRRWATPNRKSRRPAF